MPPKISNFADLDTSQQTTGFEDHAYGTLLEELDDMEADKVAVQEYQEKLRQRAATLKMLGEIAVSCGILLLFTSPLWLQFFVARFN